MMASKTPCEVSAPAAPGRGVQRRVLGRALASPEIRARQGINAHLLGLDDATLATFGYDRRAVELAGSGRFPL